jgi:hypothetical protein
MLSQCPVCAGTLHISELSCGECSTKIAGSFESSRLSRLNREHEEFLVLFLRSRGNLSAVADTLEVSFPTASRRLDAALIALGFMEGPVTNGKSAHLPPEPDPFREQEREHILEMLDRGELTAEEATHRLKDI